VWLARAAGPDAEVHYSDSSEANAREARRYFEQAGVESRITIHTANALDALAGTPGEFDLIFNDVDKEGYPAVLEAVRGRLRRGGVLVADNTLWYEKVLRPEDAASRGIVTFNTNLFKSKDFQTTLIPLRDGVTVSVRL
jgi:caffeoyl-CoA O-methyltransferase